MRNKYQCLGGSAEREAFISEFYEYVLHENPSSGGWCEDRGVGTEGVATIRWDSINS
jgi:hypothetical protein